MDLVLGGIRSGKSCFAESLAESLVESYARGGRALHYLATAEIVDADFAARVERHSLRRGDSWVVHEEALRLGDSLTALAGEDIILLLDSVDMWVNNLLYHGADIDLARRLFLRAVEDFKGDLILVSSEVGLSLVPAARDSARFCDIVGELNQALAALAVRVIFVTAGLPLYLKGDVR